jgi:hypothetical protein
MPFLLFVLHLFSADAAGRLHFDVVMLLFNLFKQQQKCLPHLGRHL